MKKGVKCIMFKVGNKLSNTNASALQIFIDTLKDKDEVVVEFKRRSDFKSNEQLRLAHMIMSDISSSTGNTVDAIDAYIKQEMGLGHIEKIKGKEVFTCESKADFSKDQLSDYIARLLVLAGELDVNLEHLGQINQYLDS